MLSADRSRYLQPGEDETGWTARRGRGYRSRYLNDREATERTFPVIDGQRVSAFPAIGRASNPTGGS